MMRQFSVLSIAWTWVGQLNTYNPIYYKEYKGVIKRTNYTLGQNGGDIAFLSETIFTTETDFIHFIVISNGVVGKLKRYI